MQRISNYGIVANIPVFRSTIPKRNRIHYSETKTDDVHMNRKLFVCCVNDDSVYFYSFPDNRMLARISSWSRDPRRVKYCVDIYFGSQASEPPFWSEKQTGIELIKKELEAAGYTELEQR